jgi:hypothetical protein
MGFLARNKASRTPLKLMDNPTPISSDSCLWWTDEGLRALDLVFYVRKVAKKIPIQQAHILAKAMDKLKNETTSVPFCVLPYLFLAYSAF